VRTRVWTAVRDRSGVAGKASGRRRGGRSRAERRTWRADSSVAMLAIDTLRSMVPGCLFLVLG